MLDLMKDLSRDPRVILTLAAIVTFATIAARVVSK